VLSDTAQADALALSAGVCHKGDVRRLREFKSIAAFFSNREIDKLQAAIDARREARAEGAATSQDDGPTQAAAAGSGTPEGGERPD
jgi:hypothetical protein